MLRLALVLSLAPLSLFAQEVDCVNQPTQLDMTMCAHMDWQAADAELNLVYTDAIAAMQDSDAAYLPQGATEEDRLRAAQRAWVAFRDANCDVAGSQMRDGSGEPMLVNICLHQMTLDRTAELATLLGEY